VIGLHDRTTPNGNRLALLLQDARCASPTVNATSAALLVGQAAATVKA